MKDILINCEKLRSRKVLHDYLEQELHLPDYYGRNLDALYDILSGFNKTGAVTFHIINREKQSSRMVSLYQAMLDMLTEWIRTDPRGEEYRDLDWSKEYDLARNGDPNDTQTAL